MKGRKRGWEGPPFGKHEFQDQCDQCLFECWQELPRIERLADLGAHMDQNDFRFAKTMPDAPHWEYPRLARYFERHTDEIHYTLRKTWENDEEFVACVQFIRDHGNVEYFWGKPYTKLEHGGYKYWSMGYPLDVTIIINRAEHPSPVFDEVGNRLAK
jgi:hypothetical protein